MKKKKHFTVIRETYRVFIYFPFFIFNNKFFGAHSSRDKTLFSGRSDKNTPKITPKILDPEIQILRF
jgi:hypothetical protein